MANTFKWRRQLTRAESRVKLEELEETFDSAEELYVSEISAVLRQSLNRMQKDVSKALQNDDLVSLRNLKVGYHDKLVNIIKDVFVKTYLYGHGAVYEEIGMEVNSVKKRKYVQYFRAKAEAIVTELEGRLKARIILIVLAGLNAGRSEKEISAEIGVIELSESKQPSFEKLKAGKVSLTKDEREEVMKSKAVWHNGPGGKPSPAVWKSVVSGKTWYVTHTHRAYNVTSTLKGTIKRYHDFIKETA